MYDGEHKLFRAEFTMRHIAVSVHSPDNVVPLDDYDLDAILFLMMKLITYERKKYLPVAGSAQTDDAHFNRHRRP